MSTTHKAPDCVEISIHHCAVQDDSSELNVCVCVLSFQNYYQNKLRLAIIGQSLFGQEVYSSLRKQGHKVVGVFTVPDKDGKADPLGE